MMKSENATTMRTSKEDLIGKPPLCFPLQIRCHHNVNCVTIFIILKVITGFEL